MSRSTGPGSTDRRDLHADLLLGWPEDLESLSVVDPLKNGRFAYTTKVTGMPATGTIRVGQETWECSPSEALGELDWSRGFLESVTPWKWATASGRTPQGQTVGFNLCSGFHDGGDNENAVVVDGHLTKLGLVSFTHDQAHIMQPWHISSLDRSHRPVVHPDGGPSVPHSRRSSPESHPSARGQVQRYSDSGRFRSDSDHGLRGSGRGPLRSLVADSRHGTTSRQQKPRTCTVRGFCR